MSICYANPFDGRCLDGRFRGGILLACSLRNDRVCIGGLNDQIMPCLITLKSTVADTAGCQKQQFL